MDSIHAESLASLLASLRRHASPLAAIPALPALHRGDVIAIQGPASSGKTHLLYHVLLALLVPGADADAQTEIAAAVVYDTDASFDIQRFRHLLLSRMPRVPSSALDPLELVRRTLARLHVFRPSSLPHLAASIAHLPAYHASRMPNQEIAVLAVDSISAFYWPDRFSAEQLRNIAPGKANHAIMAPPLHRVFSAIQGVQRSHAPLAILTHWAPGPLPPYDHSRPSHRQHRHPESALEDAIAALGAKSPGNTDHSPSSPFRLAHHITLSSPSPDQPSVAPSDNALLRETRHGSRTVSCVVSSSETREPVRFTFEITDDDVLVQP